MPQDYDKHRDDAAARERFKSARGREIGPLDDIGDEKRRESCKFDLAKYALTYHAGECYLGWSRDHKKAIRDIERAVLDPGGQTKALAMPRGSGKSTINEIGIGWSLNYRHHVFGFLIAANDDKATEAMEGMQLTLCTNELLAEDFPEICQPLRALEFIAQRAKGQTLNGVPTYVKFGSNVIHFASYTRAGTTYAGGVLKAAGLRKAVRGANVVTPDGRRLRPTIVLLDDIQTDDVAASPPMVRKVLKIVSAGVLKMAPPDQALSAMATVTVIEPNDAAHQLLNRELYPDWLGQTTRMLMSWPDRMDLWERYNEIRIDELHALAAAADDDECDEPAAFEDKRNKLKATPLATKFYADNREEMDRGASVSWPARFIPGKELSGIQHAMNHYFRDQPSFFSEMQNEPLGDGGADEEDSPKVSSADVLRKVDLECSLGIVPRKASHLTAFVDVGHACLFYAVVAWADDFTGWVIDYGAWPDQGVRYFTNKTVKRTLTERYESDSPEMAIFDGLRGLLDGETNEDGEATFDGLMARNWPSETGAEFQIGLCLVDAGDETKTVFDAVASMQNKARIRLSFGRSIRATTEPMASWKCDKSAGERRGDNWIIKRKDRPHPWLLFDANAWKTFVCRRIAVDAAKPGGLSLFGRGRKRAAIGAKYHQLLADHIGAAETVQHVKVENTGRAVWEWGNQMKRANHLFDCVVGSAVAASITGCKLATVVPKKKKKKKKRRKPKAKRCRSIPIT